MIARLETIFYFERERSFQKIARLAFMILHKLAILAQEVSIYIWSQNKVLSYFLYGMWNFFWILFGRECYFDFIFFKEEIS